MFLIITNQFGWFVLVIAAILFWIVVKFLRNVFLKVVGIIFAVLSILRLWPLL